MPSSEDEIIIGNVTAELADPSRRVIAFVGSGLSRAAPYKIPTWIEAFHRLCDKAEDICDSSRVQQIRDVAKVAGYDPEFLIPCFERLMSEMGATGFESTVKHIFTPEADGVSDAHRELVRIPFTGFLTTNLDETIEGAVDDAFADGARPSTCPVWTCSDGRGQSNLTRQSHWIWKLHGTISRPESWVLTREQYARSIYATDSYTQALRDVVASSRVVFFGFGGSDPDIDRCFQLLAAQGGGRADPHVLFTRSMEKELKRSLLNQNVYVIEYGGASDHSKLVHLLRKFPNHEPRVAPPGLPPDKAYRDSVLASHTKLSLARLSMGTGAAAPVDELPVAQIYAELFVQRGPGNWSLEGEDQMTRAPLGLTDVVETCNRVLILGEPGSGKTTFLRYLSYIYASDTGRPLPMWLNCDSILDGVIATERPSEALLRSVHRELLSGQVDWTVADVERRIAAGSLCLMIDAVDLITPNDRLDQVSLVLQDAALRWPDARILVAARPATFSTSPGIPRFEEVRVAGLSEEAIREFAEDWYECVLPRVSEETRTRKAADLFNQVRSKLELRKLSSSPVMLTCMAVLHSHDDPLPVRRADLLEAVFQWLIGRPPDHEDVHLTPRMQEEAYCALAAAMMRQEGKRLDRIAVDGAAEVFAQFFSGSIPTARAYLEDTAERCGLLVLREDQQYAFWHLSFQEYLAARQLAGMKDDPDDGWWSEIRGRIDSPEWREVVTYLPSCFRRLGKQRVELFFDRLARSCTCEPLATRAKRTGLGGRILQELSMTLQGEGVVPEWQRLVEDVGQLFRTTELVDLPLRDKIAAATAYGIGGDVRIRSPEAWIGMPEGSALLGAQSTSCDADNYDPLSAEWEGPVSQTRLNAFAIRRYLTTAEEFAVFVEAGGYRNRSLWSDAGWRWRQEGRVLEPAEWDSQLEAPNSPVTGVSWFEACAFCGWLDASQLVQEYYHRLPHENEWEYTARRGTVRNQRFSWGNDLAEGNAAESNWAGCDVRRKTPVGLFPMSTTIDGVADLIGNVEEWCLNTWAHERPVDAGAEETSVLPLTYATVRGGSTIRFMRLCRPSYRSRTQRGARYQTIGFRTVRIPVD